MIIVDETDDPIENLLEFQFMSGILAEMDHAELYKGKLRAFDEDEAITHYIRARIQSENYFFFY